MTETNNTIGELVADLRPVRPVFSTGIRMMVWLGMAAVGVGIFLTLITARRDLGAVVRSGRLLTDFATVALIALTASWGALQTSVPGEEKPWAHQYLPVALLAFWFFFTLIYLVADVARAGMGAFVPDTHGVCALLVAVSASVLSLPVGILIRRAAPINPRWCGALAALAASSTAMVGIDIICVHEQPAHVGLYHVLPVVVFTVVGAMVGPRIFQLGDKK